MVELWLQTRLPVLLSWQMPPKRTQPLQARQVVLGMPQLPWRLVEPAATMVLAPRALLHSVVLQYLATCRLPVFNFGGLRCPHERLRKTTRFQNMGVTLRQRIEQTSLTDVRNMCRNGAGLISRTCLARVMLIRTPSLAAKCRAVSLRIYLAMNCTSKLERIGQRGIVAHQGIGERTALLGKRCATTSNEWGKSEIGTLTKECRMEPRLLRQALQLWLRIFRWVGLARSRSCGNDGC
mmetsp:Transcript_98138/g.194325  ORF Transcript_98138/g.194325 Transcript_98138/m.194325 type:complete len:237 (-) Transcript_98138:213-923(-)